MRISSIAALVTASLLLANSPVHAAQSTSDGRVSVAQVMEMVEAVSTKPEALQILTAYLAGVGEAAGILTAAKDSKGRRYVSCARPLSVDANAALAAMNAAAPDRGKWGQIAATPILVAEITGRAGCK
ncbi:chlorophyllide reductase [Devosia sp.]|uniref:chlorophyllide reductase n=1 Tax=Devosia sp. TaxID=1871048 RepID=UPI003BA86CBC